MSEARTIEKKIKENKSPEITLAEMRLKLQKLILDIKSGKEKNTSLIKKSKKEIAKLLTNLNTKNGK